MAPTDNILDQLKNLKIKEEAQYTFVDSEEKLSAALDSFVNLLTNPPSIYMDLEGAKLSRNGTISIIQLLVLPLHHTYLIDVHQLQHKAFSTVGTISGKSLKTIMEAENIPKAIFDVRNDSDALYHLYGIKVAGIEDIQLMELGSRTNRREFVSGLAKCIERDCVMSFEQRQKWKVGKEQGNKLFSPEKGGSYEVFNERPLAIEIMEYCIEDVQWLPKLWQHYDNRLSARWRSKVKAATSDRVAFSQGPIFLEDGKHKALAPPGWAPPRSRGRRSIWL